MIKKNNINVNNSINTISAIRESENDNIIVDKDLIYKKITVGESLSVDYHFI